MFNSFGYFRGMGMFDGDDAGRAIGMGVLASSKRRYQDLSAYNKFEETPGSLTFSNDGERVAASGHSATGMRVWKDFGAGYFKNIAIRFHIVALGFDSGANFGIIGLSNVGNVDLNAFTGTNGIALVGNNGYLYLARTYSITSGVMAGTDGYFELGFRNDVTVALYDNENYDNVLASISLAHPSTSFRYLYVTSNYNVGVAYSQGAVIDKVEIINL